MYDRFKIASEYLNSLGVTQEGKIFLTVGTKRIPIGWLKKLNCGSYLYEKQVKVTNVFKKNMSWGLNWAVLSGLGNHGYIRLYSDDNRVWEISAEEAKESGSFLFFKDKGFERQYFVPLKHWRVTRA